MRATLGMLSRNAIFLTLVLALIVRLYHVNYPFIDHQDFRQADTANVARGFNEHGFNIFYPEAAESGQGNGAYEMEFGLAPFLVALLYAVFGVHEWVGRVASVAPGIVTILFVYALAKLHFPKRTALLAALFVAFMPLTVYYDRTVMPESLMMMASVGSLYLGSLYNVLAKDRWLVAASALASIATLLKVTSLWLVLPLGFLVVERRGLPRTMRDPWVWGCLVVILLPSVLWYGYAHFVLLPTYHLTFHIWDFGYRGATGGTLTDPTLYLNVWSYLLFLIFSPPGLALFAVGILSPFALRRNYVFATWALAMVPYAFGTATRLIFHEYYLLPLAPLAAILMAVGTWRIYDLLQVGGNDSVPGGARQGLRAWAGRAMRWPHRQGGRAFVVAVVVIFLFSSYLGLMRWEYVGLFAGRGDMGLFTAGRVTDGLAPVDSRVIIGSITYSMVTYYAHRDTLFYTTMPPTPQGLEELHSRGGAFFVATDYGDYTASADFISYMTSRYNLITDGSNYIAFDLTAPPRSPFPSTGGRGLPGGGEFGGSMNLTSVITGRTTLGAGEIFFLGMGWHFNTPPTRDLVVGIKCWRGDAVEWGWDHTIGLGIVPRSSMGPGVQVWDNLTYVIPHDALPGACQLTAEVGWPSVLEPGAGNWTMYNGRVLLTTLGITSSYLTPFDLWLEPHLIARSRY